MTQPIVQIYDIDAFLHRELAPFLCCGYAQGHGGIIAASKAHREALAARTARPVLNRLQAAGRADDAGTPFHDRREQSNRSVQALQRDALALEAEIARREDAERRLDRLIAHQDRLVEEERKRIARELHDELGSLLTGINANMSVALARAEREGRAPERELLVAFELAELAVQTVSRVVTELRPSVLDHLGIWSALEWYAAQVRQRTHLRCRCSVDPALRGVELDAELGTALFRIVQEALTNAARHAQATRVAIRAAREQDDAVIEIKDNGCGIDTDRLLERDAFGIAGMYERARQFGGDIKIAGLKGRGTAVTLRFKLAAAEPAPNKTIQNNEVETCPKEK